MTGHLSSLIIKLQKEKEPAGSEETSEDQNEKEEDDFEVFDL